MNLDDLAKLLGILGTGLVGIVAWIWRIARHDQERGQCIQALQQWQTAHTEEHRQEGRAHHTAEQGQRHDLQELTNRVTTIEGRQGQQGEALKTLAETLKEIEQKRSERDARIFAQLDEINRVQAAQGEQLKYISENCTETRNTLMDVLATRQPGGRRCYDQMGE